MKNNNGWLPFDCNILLTMMVIGIVLVSLFIMASCGINISNTQNQTSASVGANAISDSLAVEEKECFVTWEYITDARSSLTILIITGAESGSYEGTCSDGSEVNGMFSEGTLVDACEADNENVSTFSTECGWSEIITFNS